jgi:hypothetical protein
VIPEPIKKPNEGAAAGGGKKEGALTLSRSTAAPVSLVVYRAEAGRVFLSGESPANPVAAARFCVQAVVAAARLSAGPGRLPRSLPAVPYPPTRLTLLLRGAQATAA